MHRFYLPPSQAQGSSLTITGREAHHAIHVLRVKRGEHVVVLDGAGGEVTCDVCEVDRHKLGLAVLQKTSVPPLPFRIVLAQALTKGKSMDLIVQKATELGVHRIVPILSDRSVVQVEEESAAAKVEKWQTIAIESIKQCGSPWLPSIDHPMTPQSFLMSGEKFDLMLIASLQTDARHPREHFERFRGEHHREPKTLCVWIGPEGDFTPAEIHAIKNAAALPISLGPLVLRSETAAIYSLAVLNYELQATLQTRPAP